jgi:hypothetical protein
MMCPGPGIVMCEVIRCNLSRGKCGDLVACNHMSGTKATISPTLVLLLGTGSVDMMKLVHYLLDRL